MKKFILFTSLTLVLLLHTAGFAEYQITGTVFHDLNENRQMDANDPGIPDVMVSNGSEIVTTDENGRYSINAEDNSIIFVIKPSGWTTHVDKNGIPLFYHIISSQGAGGEDYPGLDPTGTPPESVDFPLYPQEEQDSFRVVVFGDTQPRNLEEVNYIAHDSVQELIGVDAAFGVTLGDLVFDDLNLFQPLNEVIGQIGIPWRHVIGNHDIDFSADTNWDARGAYYRTYGPSWYAFTKGSTHFVAIDNIRWVVEGDERRHYTGLGDRQMEFVANFLDKIPENDLVVFFTHMPWVDSTRWLNEEERLELFQTISSRPHTVTLAAHHHQHHHRFIDNEDGWPGEEPHHMIVTATVCGAWWTGSPDEFSIPHSMMHDGTPSGYAYLDINGSDWSLAFKAARRPADFQMSIYSPDEVPSANTEPDTVYANIFNAMPDAEVKMRIGETGSWNTMSRNIVQDPFFVAMRERERNLENRPWRLVYENEHPSLSIWTATLPKHLEPGAYTLYIKAEDRWDTYRGNRVIRVVE